MKHLKLTVLGLLALTTAASDAFAFGPPGPPPHLPMGGGLPRPRLVVICRVCRWAAADPSAISWHAAPRGMLPGISRHAAPQETPPGISRQAPRGTAPETSRHAP